MARKVFPPDDHIGGGGVLVHDPVLGHVAAQLPLHGGEVHSLVSSAIVTRMIKMHPYLFTPNLFTWKYLLIQIGNLLNQPISWLEVRGSSCLSMGDWSKVCC